MKNKKNADIHVKRLHIRTHNGTTHNPPNECHLEKNANECVVCWTTHDAESIAAKNIRDIFFLLFFFSVYTHMQRAVLLVRIAFAYDPMDLLSLFLSISFHKWWWIAYTAAKYKRYFHTNDERILTSKRACMQVNMVYTLNNM